MTVTLFLELCFWCCLLLVFYTFVGYGMLLWPLVKWKEWLAKPKINVLLIDNELPDITLFVTAYNEEDTVAEKMENSFALDYPSEKLHILWLTDGSNDSTVERLKAYLGIEVQHSPERRGKTAAINRGMQFVKTSIVVFCDANSILNPLSLRIIASQFADPTVGCVSGEKRIEVEQQSGVSSKGESAYWKYESFLKNLDSRFYSAVGAAGELFAIRRELFELMPEDTLLDDFILSMRIAQQGYRIAYTPDAYAVEKGSLNMEEEAKRKKRICAGGLQSIIRLAPLLNVFKYGKLSFLYISHRVLRWSVTPFALFLLFPLSLFLAFSNTSCSWIFGFALLLQVIFYLMAYCGFRLHQRGIKSKLLYIPYYFVFMNLNVFSGIRYLWNNKNKGGSWEKSKRR